jgi:hypothetical protein
VYLRARYYDPTVGRFLTADSIVPDPFSSQGWNGYTYVANNPLRFVDPSGHCFALTGVDFIVCATIASAAGAYLSYELTKIAVDNAPAASEAMGELAGGLVDVLTPPAVPYDQEAIMPCPPDPAIYNPGPVLGGEFTGPLHLPGGSTTDLPDLGTGADFPLTQSGDGIVFSSYRGGLYGQLEAQQGVT